MVPTSFFNDIATTTTVLVLLCLTSSPSLMIVAQDDANSISSRWTLVAPSSTSLPFDEPPSTFNRSANIISPVGAASFLGDARPALLQTNKFYSNFLVRALVSTVLLLSYLVAFYHFSVVWLMLTHHRRYVPHFISWYILMISAAPAEYVYEWRGSESSWKVNMLSLIYYGGYVLRGYRVSSLSIVVEVNTRNSPHRRPAPRRNRCT